jgi:hypothetical protein
MAWPCDFVAGRSCRNRLNLARPEISLQHRAHFGSFNLEWFFHPLGKVFNIFRWPVGDLHAKGQAHLRQDFLDFV